MTMTKRMLLMGCAAVLCLANGVSQAQTDLRNRIVPVYDGRESTALSIFDANPESPDGAYLCFIRYPEIVHGGHAGPPVRADVMIRDNRTGATEKAYEVRVTNHNGANAVWIDSETVAFQVNHLKDFCIYDVRNKKPLFGLIDGELGHKSFGGKLYYTVCGTRLREIEKTRQPYDPAAEGMYCFDVRTGKKEMVASKERIVRAYATFGHTAGDGPVAILHAEPNPGNGRLIFDFRYSGKEVRGIMNTDGSEIRALPVRPMHCVWFDDDFLLGVYTADPGKRIYRFDLRSDRVELVGGRATHVGQSPDRQWYIGESGYYGPEEDGCTRVYLYRRGVTEPVALLAEWKNNKITWEWVAHVNPSFSSDGRRGYFIRAADTEDRFEAVRIDFTGVDELRTIMNFK